VPVVLAVVQLVLVPCGRWKSLMLHTHINTFHKRLYRETTNFVSVRMLSQPAVFGFLVRAVPSVRRHQQCCDTTTHAS
jgi:hypothetical protein